MNIVIIADFIGRLNDSDNNRFIYIAEMLLEKGHDVEIVTSNFDHGTKQRLIKKDEYHGIKITMLNEPSYSKNVCIKRFFAHYSWGKAVGKYLKSRNKPDLVYCAIPTLKAASVAGKYCNKHNVKFVIDVQDLWPEAYKMVFNVPLLSSIIFSPFKVLSNSAYKRADCIIAVSQTYVNRALKVNRKVEKGYSVFLGTDLSVFDSFSETSGDFVKKDGEIWLAYCGTLGASYDLKIVFDAMRLLNEPLLKFIVMGSGPRYEEFKDLSKDLNVYFPGKLSYKEMCSVLKKCDIAVNPITHNAAQSIINKHADYAASGLPVLNTQENKEYRQLIDAYNMGFNINNGDFNELAKKLRVLCSNNNLRNEMGYQSRKCAEDLFDRSKTYKKILNIIEEDD